MKYTLRPYQQDIIDKVRAHVQKGHRKVLVFAATGAGKTIMSYDIIRNALARGNRVLFTAHRITLAEQSASKFSDLDPGYIQGQSKDSSKPLTVATLQTLIDVEIPPVDIVIIDEVHYGYESSMIQSLFKKFPDAVFIGLSATPVDDRGFLLEGFDAIVDDYQTVDLMNIGALVPFTVYSEPCTDISGVRVKGNDYDEKELEKVINVYDSNASIVDSYMKHGDGRKFICFAVNKKHCKDLQEMFMDSCINTEVISADTSKKERDRILSDFAKGIVQGLISIEILTAGFDDPTVSCVIMATATKSWKKYVQCAGRGIRLMGNSIEESIKNGKKDCILIDCASNVAEHGMPDDRKSFIFGKKISRVIDRELNLDVDIVERKKELPVERQLFLKRIGSLLDLYDGKYYRNESELQEDVNSFLDKTQYFWWRQNSGKMYKDGRWIHFASKSGLPDNTVFFRNTSIFFGVELKLPTGRLTDHQKKTIPEMTQRGVLVFIAESVYDVYKAIDHIEMNVDVLEDSTVLRNTVYDLPDRQIELRNRLKLPMYGKL